MPNSLRKTGRRSSALIQDLGLWLVLAATIFAGAQEVWSMIEARVVLLTDILLLFIYLEVISMVDVYWKSGQLPVRMPLYIAMVALARYIILEASHLGAWHVIGLSGGILVLALAVLVIRYGHLKLPYPETAGSELSEGRDENLHQDARRTRSSGVE